MVRVPFELPAAYAVLGLELKMNFDDGFVAYINGTEVARSNAPGGTPAWNSAAAGDRDDEARAAYDAAVRESGEG